MKTKVKEKWIKNATIIVQTLIERTENPKGCFSIKSKLINVLIKKSTVNYSSSFPITKKGTKELLKFIEENLHLI